MISGRGLNGAAVHCLLLSSELARRGHDVVVACPAGSWVGERASSLGLEVLVTDLRRFPPGELGRIAAEVRVRGVDVVHTHMSRAHFFGVLLRLWSDVPVVATAHACFIQAHWAFNHRILAVSHYGARFHHRFNLVPRSRLEVIHGFVDTAVFGSKPREVRRRVRASLGIDDRAPLVGVVGTLFLEKGLGHLLRAWPGVVARVGAARLLVVGGGYESVVGRLRREADRLGVAGSVVWAGQRGDMGDVMASLDLLVHPSERESLSLACLEALASEVPVVAAAVGGVPECVRHGENGLLVRPRDSAALRDAILTLLDDPERRRAFGARGRRDVVEGFSASSQVPRVEAALAGTVARARRTVRTT
jgi:L-malate glycosyltransferase